MLKKILPAEVFEALSGYKIDNIYEIRVRDGQAVSLNYSGSYECLRNGGKKIIAKDGECEKILARATEYSMYAVNNQIVKGFVSVKGGVRIGLCGEIVTENGQVKTVRNCSSLNIRIPHEVIGCGNGVIRHICDTSSIKNTFIVSPPGKGKTIILRDIARALSDAYGQNVLVVDERQEIAASFQGRNFYNVGSYSDVISGGDKMFAFTYAIRSMSPQVIITDEIVTDSDYYAVKYASECGVKIIASIHAGSIAEIKRKSFFNGKNDGFAERFVLLSGDKRPGVISAVYDGEYKELMSYVN